MMRMNVNTNKKIDNCAAGAFSRQFGPNAV